VQVDQGSTSAAVTHARHQLTQVRPGRRGQVTSGMAQIVEMHRGQASLAERRERGQIRTAALMTLKLVGRLNDNIGCVGHQTCSGANGPGRKSHK
jgi:hypothetical protein